MKDMRLIYIAIVLVMIARLVSDFISLKKNESEKYNITNVDGATNAELEKNLDAYLHSKNLIPAAQHVKIISDDRQ